MKKMKKMLAMLLAVVMTMAMTVTTFAAQTQTTTGDLTVTAQAGSLKGQTIYLFKLFTCTKKDPYEYTVNENYKTALNNALKLSNKDSYDLYSAIASLGSDGAQKVQDFANNFTKEIIKTGTISGQENQYYKLATVDIETTQHVFTNVDSGYYLVYLGGSQTIQSSLVTVDGKTEVILKSTTPTPEKSAHTSDGKNPVTDVQIGDVIQYKVKMKVPDISAFNEKTYVFKLKDTLSAGLDFVKDKNGTAVGEDNQLPVTVTVGGPVQPGTPVQPALNATVNTDTRTMTLDLSQVVKNNQDKIGKEIVVSYFVKVNKKAVIDNTQNSAKLEYSNKPGTTETTESLPSIVKTPTFPLNIHKYEEGKKTEYLAGAKFELRKADGQTATEGTLIKMEIENNNGKYVVAADQKSPTAISELVTVNTNIDNSGYNLQINGLAAGTYYLVEKEPPKGFNKIDPIKIVIANTTKDGTLSYTVTVNDGKTPAAKNIVDVINRRGVILPGTGGMGTVLFTVIGVALILGVGASFVISRKRKAE